MTAIRFRRQRTALLLAAWRWLAAEADDLSEKRRCLEAILGLDPDSEWAHTAKQCVLQEQQQIANDDRPG